MICLQRKRWEDVLTELPPSSRFFQEDLDNFGTFNHHSFQCPSLLLSNLKPDKASTSFSLRIIALSSPSLCMFSTIYPQKTLIGLDYFPSRESTGWLGSCSVGKMSDEKNQRNSLCFMASTWSFMWWLWSRLCCRGMCCMAFDLSSIGDSKDDVLKKDFHASTPPLTLDYYGSHPCPSVFEIVKKEHYIANSSRRIDSFFCKVLSNSGLVLSVFKPVIILARGTQTIGMAHCANFRARIYGDFEATSDRSPVSVDIS
ncbi:hypothetical protein NC653_019833 [Populus alba x Populus x berolinensis]|uniref:Uncharacterized protein n=1 Tax=Populus alba x Populus x berolinensis TaxID=444605 RepID=A0AAD6QD49_9ROSI|nr:hypothetical protein NC653_019833 [Populus alba x Populus x berolinensis]